MDDTHPILDDPRVRMVLFHPRRARIGNSRFPGAQDGTVTVDAGKGVAVGYRLFPAPDANAPVILYFHGNGEIAADYDEIARLYTARNISLCVADFRGYGWSNGNPEARNLLPDARAVADAFPGLLHEAGLNPARKFALGRSLGSPCAIDVVARKPEAWSGLIIESGFSDAFELLARLGLPFMPKPRAGEVDGINNLEKMGRIALPTLVIHGEKDTLIPATHGKALHAAGGAADKRLLLIPGAGHNDLMFTGLNAYMQAVADFCG